MAEAITDAIVVAAGASRRMGGVDKLDADLGGRPLLAWAVEAMARARQVRSVIVVTGDARVEALQAARWLTALGGRVVAGGRERSDSVRAGLAASDADIVLVHDGARPLASFGLAEAVGEAAQRHGAAVPVVAVADSLKRVDGGLVAASVERGGLVRAQTPQGARRELLAEAFARAGDASFTDEAALLEAAGVAVATVAGEAANIKVTEPEDLELVRAIAGGRAASRVGLGSDNHPFGPEDGLWLGGVLIAEAPRLHGHSDGDAALHAVATAILSACGLGDLGRLFPATDAALRGAPSSGFVIEAAARAGGEGWHASAVQLSIIAARPRLGADRLERMRDRVAELLSLERGRVAVTASSGNLAGPEGAGRAVSATALVTLEHR